MTRRSFIATAILAATLAGFIPLACMTTDTRNLYPDIATSGFLSGDCYQSVLDFPPDADLQGLVKQRENALKKAQSMKTVNWLVLERLVEYSTDRIMKSPGKITDLAKLKSALREELLPFLGYGKVEYTYFREDNAAVVVHRIVRKDLRKRLDSIEISFDEKK